MDISGLIAARVSPPTGSIQAVMCCWLPFLVSATTDSFANCFGVSTADPDIRYRDSFGSQRRNFNGAVTQAERSYKQRLKCQNQQKDTNLL